MTRTISNAERRAVQHENAARDAIEAADTAVARAEREMIEFGGAGDPHAEIRQTLLRVYATTRALLDAARGALNTP